jgi:phospholipid transport system transporter-binding protein
MPLAAMFQTPDSLTLANAKAVLAEGLRAIAAGQAEIDLSRLAAVDSSAVATLLAWKRDAASRGSTLALRNPPTSLHSLIQLYGVADLLH